MHQHQEQANGQWKKLTLAEQMANIGSEVIRALNWRDKNNSQYAQMAFERSLELFFLTIDDPKNHTHRLKEILRAQETWIDYFACDNEFNSSKKSWENYFLNFNYLARNK